jgi:hypothetical protein
MGGAPVRDDHIAGALQPLLGVVFNPGADVARRLSKKDSQMSQRFAAPAAAPPRTLFH